MNSHLNHLLSEAKYTIKVSNRQARLFACACCRRVWHLIQDSQCQAVVEVMERYSDRQATKAEVGKVLAAVGPEKSISSYIISGLTLMVHFVHRRHLHANAVHCRCALSEQEQHSQHLYRIAEEARQCALIQDIVPFSHQGQPKVDPAWCTPAVLSLSKGVYEHRNLPAGTLDPVRLQILADALEEAHCTDEGILSHLRGPDVHVRGCWVVDLLLAKAYPG